MGRDTFAKLVTVSLGLLMFTAALVLMGLDQGTAQERPDMPYRVYAPMVANSSAPAATPTATPTVVPTATPSPTAEPNYYIEWYAFCTSDYGCPNGNEPLYVGVEAYITIVVNPGPTEPVVAKVSWNGSPIGQLLWDNVPYPDNQVLVSTLPTDSAGEYILNIWVGETYIASVVATVNARPGGGGGGGLTFASIDGRAILVAYDGTYLGLVSSNRYASESVCNRYGDYGSRYSTTSVRNPYSEYGGRYGTQSAYNPYTSTPPAIMMDGQIIGYLTKNEYHQGAVDPDALFAYYGCTY